MKGKKPNHGRGTALAASPESQGTQIKGHLWVERDGEIFLSWGRVVLLEQIRESSSSLQQPESLGDGLQSCLDLVANMNSLAGEELVGRTFGGSNGGHSYPHQGRQP